MIKQIRLSSQARDQLIRLKSKSGIGQWNILCSFLAGVARSRSVRGSHWDIFRTEIVSNWAWYRAGKETNQSK